MSEPPLLEADVSQLEHILSKIYKYCSQEPDEERRLLFVMSMFPEAEAVFDYAEERALNGGGETAAGKGDAVQWKKLSSIREEP